MDRTLPARTQPCKGAIQQLALWLLGVTIWKAPIDAGHAQAAIDAVPDPVSGGVATALVALGVVVGAYIAPSPPAVPVEHEQVDEQLPADEHLVDDDAPNMARVA